MQSRPFLLLTFSFLLLACPFEIRAQSIDIIPKPASLHAEAGLFKFDPTTVIRFDAAPADSADAARSLTDRLHAAAGLDLKVEPSAAQPGTKTVLLTTHSSDSSLGDEGYALEVNESGIIIRASSAAGLFYGAQTLLQMLPPGIYASSVQSGVSWSVPCVKISDAPRFKWRGLMLDVSRHFTAKADVLKLLDEMAVHKLNVFHWHLADDQGWRIEIKKYPKLTEIGAWRDSAGFGMDPKLSTTYGPDGKYGGFYTQADVREVVAYAAARHITIVPEIEMPGHASAALRAYPEFATPAPPSKEVKGDAGIFNGVYDPSNPKTMEFLEDVLSEVIDLFPSPYIHIGGDEVPKEPWENYDKTIAFMKEHGLSDGEHLQSYFVKQIDTFIASKGRRMLGWDEILEGGLAPGATVMSWRGVEGGLAAAKADHDVVMTPVPFCYLDSEQALNTEPHERGAVLTVQKVYSYEPIPEGLPAERMHHVLGVQGNLWTEYVPNFERAQYMLWPRAAALAEVGWTPAADRKWEDFAQRLAVDENRFEALRVKYRPQKTDSLTGAIHLDDGKIVIDNPISGAIVRYTFDGSYPTAASPVYAGPVALPQGWVQATALYFVPDKMAVPAAAAQFLDGHAVHVICTSAKDWETRQSVFYTQRWGGGPNETVTVVFDSGETKLKKITVRSGAEGKPDTKLTQGALEVSADGTSFTPAADFQDGVAVADLQNGSAIKAFRVKFLTEQKPHPVLQSVTLE